MSDPALRDARGYFMLPQGYEGGGYYVYGTPDKGAAQYAHPVTMSVILSVAARWSYQDWRKFGVGNLSLADGVKFEGHKGHQNGLDLDIRPVRKDGEKESCTRGEIRYDFEATKYLITLFLLTGRVKIIYFNDLGIPGVTYRTKHDNHFHVELHT